MKIDLTRVYEAVLELKNEFVTFTSSVAIDIALLKQDVANLKAEREGEKARRWQLYVALLAAGVAIAIAVLKK
ncbi:hypothetical protein [Lentzea sp. NBRC 102530]|uniref:hypothetical protein n=1 Tax=Lentzea sp. NBRC 102530 TaxID=3032201 RepID=UPI00255582AC|nr:hypothetical protein [Lentzea sp. NBRC 102530]